MSGRIINFNDFRRANPGLVQSRADGAVQPFACAAAGPSRRPTPGLQVARISRLLDELESLSLARERHELGVVNQSRAALETVRALFLQRPEPGRNTQGSIMGENDPQPEVDGDMLERMYQALNAGA
jgi:hypothetical protein